jgi:hypothetical protein
MQLYKVVFQTHYKDIIDTGTVLIVASNQDHAAELAIHHLQLPVSTTVFDIQRVKTNTYQLSRKEIEKKIERDGKNHYDDDKDKPVVYSLKVTAEIKAFQEANAWRTLAKCIEEQASVAKPIVNKHISDLDMHADRREFSPRPPTIEKQSIFVAPKFFQGGAARGK